jgi:hypothetical protein
MNATITIENTIDLKALYRPSPIASTGCRTCGLMGFDQALRAR